MPDLKTYFKAKLIKIMWCWHRDGHRNQLNKNKGPEVNPYFWPFIFNKGGKTSRVIVKKVKVGTEDSD